MTDNSKELALKKKCQKDHPTFTETVDGMALGDLEKKLLEYAKYREQTLLAQKKDEGLQAAKDVVTELNGPYRDTLSALKDKMAYLNLLFEEKQASTGQPLSSNG